MKKISKIAIATGVALLFVGCTEPAFNPGNKSIVFVDGKPYAVPYGAKYGTKALNNKYLISGLRKSGIDCRVGDIQWNTKGHLERYKSVKNRTDAEFISFMNIEYRNGQTNCARPLNQQEYNYYQNRQNQQSANNRAAAQSQAASDQAYYNNINNSANQQIQQRNENFYRDNYILNRAGY